jgi:hypothetical protein
MAVFFAPTVALDTPTISKVGDTPIKHGVIIRKGFSFINGDLIAPLFAICSSLL